MENEKYESIKSKIRKLMALAQGGTSREASNAKFLISKLCAQYNLSLDDIINTEEKKWYKFIIGGRKIDFKLFAQCYFKIVNVSEFSYKTPYRSKSEIMVELTAFQYAELKSLYEWHKANFKKDIETAIETIFLTYCSKHALYNQIKPDDECKELTPVEIRKIISMTKFRDTLSDNSYTKMIENS